MRSHSAHRFETWQGDHAFPSLPDPIPTRNAPGAFQPDIQHVHPASNCTSAHLLSIFSRIWPLSPTSRVHAHLSFCSLCYTHKEAVDSRGVLDMRYESQASPHCSTRIHAASAQPITRRRRDLLRLPFCPSSITRRDFLASARSKHLPVVIL